MVPAGLARSWCWGAVLAWGREHAIWPLPSFQNDPSTTDYMECRKAQPNLTLMPVALWVPALCPASLGLGLDTATGVLSLCALSTHVPSAVPCRVADADSLWASWMAPTVHRAVAGPHGVRGGLV